MIALSVLPRSWQCAAVTLYVATSDLVEQHVAFGKGALRISAGSSLLIFSKIVKRSKKRWTMYRKHAMSWTTT